ncbi:General stress protein 69 [Acaryochloris thomasi RCC1774]|uniref:General stress protein 69 n=1 Tax=Acaryochloris thomasi RCC1774 TaxID=1764569 RepID=A0A2W1JEN0_9CYAN|nr:aldo/keto reductase [Acaryochloris thomasi]PZD72179.1 General stress protein 69 [Acaryochloris thomasi RCC1774]
MSINQYYTLGRSGLRVSRLALGTMTFGTDWGWGADRETASQLFNMYVDAGGNFVDTADLYTNGTSETWVGEFIKERSLRDKVAIATKFSYNADPGNPNAGGNGRKNILRAVEGSLQRLGTDYIDLYILHTWDSITPAEEVMRTLDDLVRSGKVRYVGLSDVPAWYASRAQTTAELRGYETLSTLQLEYSLVERNIENEFVPLGTQHGMGIMVWSPLASGLLSGKYKPSEQGGEGEGRLADLAGADNPAFNKFTDRNWKIVAELEAVAKELDRSMAQVAVNWAANQPGIASVLVGATKLHQLEDNLKALEFEIPKELCDRINKASAPDPSFPYTFFTPGMQAMLTGGAIVGDKPEGYYPTVKFDAKPAGVS